MLLRRQASSGAGDRSSRELKRLSDRSIAGSERKIMSPEEIRASLIAFYNVHEPSKLQAVDYFMSWIDQNGLDAFNDLLSLKYGETIPLSGTNPPVEVWTPKSTSPVGIEEQSIPLQEPSKPLLSLPNEQITELLKKLPPIDVGQYKEQLTVLFVIVVLLAFVKIFGFLATTNLVILIAGLTSTSWHMSRGSKRRAFGSALHVFWLLYCVSSLWEPFLPLLVQERWEYSLLKSILFVYIFLPNRMFSEAGGLSSNAGNIVHVKLTTVVRDLAFFFLEICLLVYFNNNADGRLRFREICVLLVLGAVYAIGVRSLKNRDRVIEEIFTTEEQYATHLRTFKKAYFSPLGEVLTAEEMDVLTRHIEPILALSELFVQELQIAMAKDLVGPAFEKFVPFLKMYGSFCADHETKREMLRKIKERQEVNKVFEQVRNADSIPKVQTIESYLIMPVQRIPRYVLLLNEVIKKTPTWHPDYENCVRVVDKVSDVARFVNETIGSHSRTPPPTPKGSSPRISLSRSASSSSTFAGSS